jgi:hypothetical protein
MIRAGSHSYRIEFYEGVKVSSTDCHSLFLTVKCQVCNKAKVLFYVPLNKRKRNIQLVVEHRDMVIEFANALNFLLGLQGHKNYAPGERHEHNIHNLDFNSKDFQPE